MSQHDSGTAALGREWRAALFVVVGGFVIAIAVAAYFAFFSPKEPAAEPIDEPVAAQPQEQAPAAQNAEVAAALQVCKMELSNAQGFGLIPPFGKLSSPVPKATDVQGRYMCQATTGAAQYQIAGDLICRNLKDPHCVALYSVTQDGKTVLYKRQN